MSTDQTIPTINNKSQQVNGRTEMDQLYVQMMMRMRKANNYKQTQNKSANFKEATKVNKRREEQIARVCNNNITQIIEQ